jgi:hypothetical protein
LQNLEKEPALNEEELKCIDNCTEKLFITERILKGYLPHRFSKVTMRDIEERLNKPTDSYGTYFTH